MTGKTTALPNAKVSLKSKAESMLFLNPQHVSLGALTLEHVASIVVSRAADRLTVEYSDLGPFPVFADVPQERTTLTITRDLLDAGLPETDALALGHQATLSFTTAPNASDARTRTFSLTIVITAIRNDLPRDRRLFQVISCLAISTDGASDPLAEVAKGGDR